LSAFGFTGLTDYRIKIQAYITTYYCVDMKINRAGLGFSGMNPIYNKTIELHCKIDVF
jgi:hypothetical protein